MIDMSKPLTRRKIIRIIVSYGACHYLKPGGLRPLMFEYPERSEWTKYLRDVYFSRHPEMRKTPRNSLPNGISPRGTKLPFDRCAVNYLDDVHRLASMVEYREFKGPYSCERKWRKALRRMVRAWKTWKHKKAALAFADELNWKPVDAPNLGDMKLKTFQPENV